jgi:hypothetical protein
MEADKVILPTSPEAAKLVTVTGWVSRDGHFFGDDAQAEEIARYAGCTHLLCSAGCGKVVSKGSYTNCQECRAKAADEQYAKHKRAEWDGETPIYSERFGKCLFDSDAVECLMDDEGCSFDDLRPMICEPNKVGILESDNWCDDLPEDSDGELPDELQAAVDVFNEAVKDVVLSWSPTDVVATWPVKP